MEKNISKIKSNINILLQNETNCTGCSTCYNVCSSGAISMKYDKDGFIYPVIDEKLCMNCNMCVRFCKEINGKRNSTNDCIAVQAIDDNVRRVSSSGGVFTLLAKEVIKQNGVVFGAAYDENFGVKHIYINDYDGISLLQGAKYVQSYIGKSFIQVKEFLKEEKNVLFVGTPCQIAGLLSFLNGYKTDKLITVDFICHGVPSPKVWEDYNSKKNKNKKIKDIKFRDKKHGWNDYSLKWIYKDGSERIEYRYLNEYLIGFSSNFFLRQSCYNCKFKGVDRVSDLTIGDCWGIEAILPEMFDELGTSLLILHTSKGEKLWNIISNETKFTNYPIERVIRDNESIIKSVPINNNRIEFFECVDKSGVRYALKKYCSPSIKERIIQRIRLIYHKFKRRRKKLSHE